jgi:hypothetical protein
VSWGEAGPNRWRADMTLGEAIEGRHYSIACACIGPPHPSPPGTPCSCALTAGQSTALHRGAHILAKLLADRLDRLKGREFHRELRESLSRSWPCVRCALPEYAHADGLLPDWVRPHEFERYEDDPRAVAVIEPVVPPEGS